MFWWFSWSIMIGQFTARFAGGLRTWQLLLTMLVVPSIPIALWFSVLYLVHLKGICSTGVFSLAMTLVGILFVINSLDSLIRLYTESLGLTVSRLGTAKYLLVNIAAMYGLTLLFLLDFLRIHWVGVVNIALQMSCLGYLLVKKRGMQWELSALALDCHKASLNSRSLHRKGEKR